MLTRAARVRLGNVGRSCLMYCPNVSDALLDTFIRRRYSEEKSRAMVSMGVHCSIHPFEGGRDGL
ncbi:hypothetical protein [Mycetohabitans endofungorum]|uniref:hypothetical protein n=1 Tax=Mycetohabitans endofungorum TaxID=417203 RepID=UPI002B059797|nr:hypothetical protein [Mycetohabitans endofungorum]